jgi:hypothetical protein
VRFALPYSRNLVRPTFPLNPFRSALCAQPFFNPVEVTGTLAHGLLGDKYAAGP